MDTAGSPTRLRNLASWLLSQTATAAGRLVSEGLAGANLTGADLTGAELTETGARRTHYSVLAALDEFGPASQAELSRRCGIYRSDLVALVNELERAGLARRSADPDDARRNVVTITEAGEHQLLHLDQLLADIQDEVLAPLTPAERVQLLALLRRVLDSHSGS